ncbi:hypothetical protein FRB94_013906 [Tulasnella sp. JGI-2019a]|nr:hypothetical protein FRB94_013906 [Tulasnella sp. JGI-2019a]
MVEVQIYCSSLTSDVLDGISIDLFSGGADRLRHIDFSSFPMLWSSRLLSRLETLAIVGSHNVPGPSTNELTDILRRCPKLRAFRMKSFAEIRVSQSKGGVAHLPALESFELYLNDAEGFNQIISSLRIPECRKFDVRCFNVTRNVFSNDTSHFTNAFLSAVPSSSNVSLLLDAFELDLFERRTEGDVRINFSLNGDSVWEMLDPLIELTAGSVPWPPIHADIDLKYTIPFQVANILHKMPSITKLRLRGNSDQYITQLSHPTLNDGKYEWVLSNLRELILDNCPENDLQIFADLSGNRQAGADMD